MSTSTNQQTPSRALVTSSIRSSSSPSTRNRQQQQQQNLASSSSAIHYHHLQSASSSRRVVSIRENAADESEYTSALNMDTVFATMRATVLQYREAVEANEEEKSEMVETIRSLREELAQTRKELNKCRSQLQQQQSGNNNNNNNNNNTRESASSADNVNQSSNINTIIDQNVSHIDHLPPSAPVSRNNSPSRSATANNNMNNNNNDKKRTNSSAGIVSSSSATTSASRTSKSPERLNRELRIANEKMDSLARELQRVHSDYQGEIKRLRAQNVVTETKMLEAMETSQINLQNNSQVNQNVTNSSSSALMITNNISKNGQQQNAITAALNNQLNTNNTNTGTNTSSVMTLINNNQDKDHKIENLQREQQRIHQEYQAEIRRLHRMIAKLEGQVVELTEYNLAVTAQQNEEEEEEEVFHHQHETTTKW